MKFTSIFFTASALYLHGAAIKIRRNERETNKIPSTIVTFINKKALSSQHEKAAYTYLHIGPAGRNGQ